MVGGIVGDGELFVVVDGDCDGGDGGGDGDVDVVRYGGVGMW